MEDRPVHGRAVPEPGAQGQHRLRCDGRCQVRADIVLTEPGLCVVFSILQRMMNYTVEFS